MARQADVRDEAGLRAAFEAAGRARPVDIVLANAGIAPMSLGEEPHEAWQDAIDVNLTGVFDTVEIAIPSMIERGAAARSCDQLHGPPNGSAAGAAAGSVTPPPSMAGRADALLRERPGPAPYPGDSVHPTGVNTPMVVNDVMQQFLTADPGLSEAMANAFPIDMVQPVDIANAIVWLVSDDAATSPASPCRSTRDSRSRSPR